MKRKTHLLHRICSGNVQLSDLTATFRRVIGPEVQYFKGTTPVSQDEFLELSAGMKFKVVRKQVTDTSI